MSIYFNLLPSAKTMIKSSTPEGLFIFPWLFTSYILQENVLNFWATFFFFWKFSLCWIKVTSIISLQQFYSGLWGCISNLPDVTDAWSFWYTMNVVSLHLFTPPSMITTTTNIPFSRLSTPDSFSCFWKGMFFKTLATIMNYWQLSTLWLFINPKPYNILTHNRIYASDMA